MARGRKTDFRIRRAAEVLLASRLFGPREISKLLAIPERTVYDISLRWRKRKKGQQLEQEILGEELERRVREEVGRALDRRERERRRTEEVALRMRPEWERGESSPSPRDVRKYHSK